jgi:hypothetical protein
VVDSAVPAISDAFSVHPSSPSATARARDEGAHKRHQPDTHRGGKTLPKVIWINLGAGKKCEHDAREVRDKHKPCSVRIKAEEIARNHSQAQLEQRHGDS